MRVRSCRYSNSVESKDNDAPTGKLKATSHARPQMDIQVTLSSERLRVEWDGAGYEAVSEIKKVAKSDPVTAGEDCVEIIHVR